ncbi:unannotated protein [freshwater metagenome]|uniref:Unannotated protein n=1 Tax=freshwater metagenome TaxID=449393 RepID=A0A6J7U9R2_9ZZZZ
MLLIAGGTIGGLGAVLAITPPQLSSTSSLNLAGAPASIPAAVDSATPVATDTPTPAATKAGATKKATTKASTTKSASTKAATTKSASAAATSNNSPATNSAAPTTAQTADPAITPRKTVTPTPTQTVDPTPTPTKTTAPAPTKTAAPAPVSKGVTGVFTGPSTFVNYGNVQVQITVKDGRITDAVALQAPSGRNDRYTNMALPILKKQTLAAQGDNIQGASGASYTSYGWYISLQGALAKAGL